MSKKPEAKRPPPAKKPAPKPRDTESYAYDHRQRNNLRRGSK